MAIRAVRVLPLLQCPPHLIVCYRRVAPDIAGKEFSVFNPQTGDDLYSTNITCGRLAHQSGIDTETATILAGSKLGFRTWWTPQSTYNIIHPGPAQVYLTRVPKEQNIEEIVGDELEWFKIASLAQSNDTAWITFLGREVRRSLCVIECSLDRADRGRRSTLQSHRPRPLVSTS